MLKVYIKTWGWWYRHSFRLRWKVGPFRNANHNTMHIFGLVEKTPTHKESMQAQHTQSGSRIQTPGPGGARQTCYPLSHRIPSHGRKTLLKTLADFYSWVCDNIHRLIHLHWYLIHTMRTNPSWINIRDQNNEARTWCMDVCETFICMCLRGSVLSPVRVSRI